MTRLPLAASHVAAVVLLMSLIWAGYVGSRWIGSAPPTASPAAPAAAAVIGSETGGVTVPALPELQSLVHRAVSRDPFRADRSRAAVRYGSMQAHPEPDANGPADDFQLVSVLRLLGTAAGESATALAAVEVVGRGTRILRVGDEVEGYRLVSVSVDHAKFRGHDSSVVLRISPEAHH
jgi:hypothetical protein